MTVLGDGVTRLSLIIAGSRAIDPTDEQIQIAIGKLVRRYYQVSNWDSVMKSIIREVVCGDAAGSDRAGDRWGAKHGIPVWHEPITEALVKKFGKYVAPKKRNAFMGQRADAAVIFWNGISNGSTDMTTRMVLRDKPVHVEFIPPPPPKNSRKAGQS